MADLADLARRLVEATLKGDAAALPPLLHPDARLRVWGWDGAEAHRPLGRAADRLAGEWAGTDAALDICTVTASAERAIVEYRVQLTDATGRYVEHNRALVVTPPPVEAEPAGEANAGLVAHTLDLYCSAPIPTAPRAPAPAPASTTDAELHHLFEMARSGYDPRTFGIGNHRSDFIRLGVGWGIGDDPHPASGFVGGARWSEAEADARIEGVIAYFRARGNGFQWWTTPYDTPADLPQRLERHGLLRAGGYEKMARRQLADLSDIPVNPDLEVVEVDGTDEEIFQACIHVITVAFREPPEHAAEFAEHWRERLTEPSFRARNVIYLARLNGQTAGTARVSLQGPMGYLVAGSTLPEFRGQHVYSTLLRKRMEVAHQRGFGIISLDAGPMSRRVVERYGFQAYGMTNVYGWMPQMDPAVIKTLVPDE